MEESIAVCLQENKVRSIKPLTKKNKSDATQFLNEIKKFEQDRVAIAKQSAETAWKVAAGSGVIIVLLTIGIIVLAIAVKTLKQVDPFLLISHENTGAITVAKPLADKKSLTYGETLDKYWLRNFTIARNGYEWETIQNSFNTVKLMANAKVYQTYNNYIKSENSPVKTFAENNQIEIKVSGVTFLPETSKDHTLAQIQFTRNIITKAGLQDREFKTTYWNATITFDYLAEIKTEDERIINPLGFRVTSYREDEVLP